MMRKKKLRPLSLLLALLMMVTTLSVPHMEVQAEEGGVGGFVNRCYQVTLGRAADASGYADWTGQLTSGKSDGAFVAFGFVFSPEYTNANKSNGEFVTDMYTLFLGRTPDKGGYNDWVGQLNAGADRQQIFAGFANSNEFFNICTSYGITAGVHNPNYPHTQVNNVNMFVARMYRVCFNRLGDQGGQADWVNRLLSGELTGIDCAKGFILSNEYQNLGLSNEAYVKNMYAAFMGRSADEGGFRDWVAKLNAGYTRDEIFAGFANSNEFAQICANYGIIRGDYTPSNCHKGEIVVTEEDKENVGKIETKKECRVSLDGKHHLKHIDAKYNDLTIRRKLIVVDHEAKDEVGYIWPEQIKTETTTYCHGLVAPAGAQEIGHYNLYHVYHNSATFHDEDVSITIPNAVTTHYAYDQCEYCYKCYRNGKEVSYGANVPYEEQVKEEKLREQEIRKKGDYSAASKIEVDYYYWSNDRTDLKHDNHIFRCYGDYQSYVNQIKKTKRVIHEDELENYNLSGGIYDQTCAWADKNCFFHCKDTGQDPPTFCGRIVYNENYLDGTLMDYEVFAALNHEWREAYDNGTLPNEYMYWDDYYKAHATPRTDLPKYDSDAIKAGDYYVDDSQLSDSQKENMDFDTLYNLYLNTPQE